MKQLTITRDAAIAEYNKADRVGKSLLEKLFGKQALTVDITSRVTSFEDACDVLDLDADAYIEGTDDEIAYKKLKVITQALNEGWTPDWEDDEEIKYYPYFNMCSGFSFDYVNYHYRRSSLGSRLCFKSEALAKYAGTQFLPLYKALLK